MSNSPTIRILYQFICSDCKREEFLRFPFNPLVSAPELMQSVPEGWTLVIDGDNPQTPLAFCGCTAGHMELMN